MKTIIELARKLKRMGYAEGESPFSFGNRVLCEIRNDLSLMPKRIDENQAYYSPSDIEMIEEEFLRRERTAEYYRNNSEKGIELSVK